jgi:hypothetical protein
LFGRQAIWLESLELKDGSLVMSIPSECCAEDHR